MKVRYLTSLVLAIMLTSTVAGFTFITYSYGGSSSVTQHRMSDLARSNLITYGAASSSGTLFTPGMSLSPVTPGSFTQYVNTGWTLSAVPAGLSAGQVSVGSALDPFVPRYTIGGCG